MDLLLFLYRSAGWKLDTGSCAHRCAVRLRSVCRALVVGCAGLVSKRRELPLPQSADSAGDVFSRFVANSKRMWLFHRHWLPKGGASSAVGSVFICHGYGEVGAGGHDTSTAERFQTAHMLFCCSTRDDTGT